MKPWTGVVALVGAASGLLAPSMSDEVTIVVAGDFRGQLSPCGCTSPMTGGIRRAAVAIRTLGSKRIFLVNGALGSGIGTQMEFKVQTLAQSLHAMGAVAINVSDDDRALGDGFLANVNTLSGDVLLSGESRTRKIGDLTIVGMRREDRSNRLPAGKVGVLFDGDETGARAIAQRLQPIFVVYRSAHDADREPIRVGSTWLISPGIDGKALVSFTLRGRTPARYQVTKLEPKFGDDPTVSRFYATYLRRVDRADLLAKAPRPDDTRYVGSSTCVKCHADAGVVWSKSGHSRAFATLETQGHGKDPDCVECHVVGLPSVYGFQSRAATPDLAAVGCESCHGGGKAHAETPSMAKMGKIGAKSCAPCHVSNHSPSFDFARYWPKVAHR